MVSVAIPIASVIWTAMEKLNSQISSFFLATSEKDVDGHAAGDIDCNGKVEFADFLVLSGNFGKYVGGAESVPEPSGLWLLSFAAMFCGLMRRRRS